VKSKAQQGFTLIELMVTVAVVGILAAIAYPSYTRYVVKTNRSAAESFMLGLANKQEQYRIDTRNYASDPAILLPTPPEVSKNYSITISNITGSTYTINAAPNASQLAGDPICKTLTLNQDGTKGITGTGMLSQCW